jgi:hypothetical protein
MYIDTLRAYDRLQKSGMPDPQARAVVEILSNMVAAGWAEQEIYTHPPTQIIDATSIERPKPQGWQLSISTAFRSKWFLRGMITIYGLTYGFCWYLVTLIPRH